MSREIKTAMNIPAMSLQKILFTGNGTSPFISIGFLLWIFISIARKYENKKAPSGFQNAMEPLILFIRDDIAKAVIGEGKYDIGIAIKL